jgi:hypothetical protein
MTPLPTKRRRPRPAHVCNHCAMDVGITHNGRARPHQLPDGSRCPGSGKVAVLWSEPDTPIGSTTTNTPPTPKPHPAPPLQPPPRPQPMQRLSPAENGAIEHHAVAIVREHFERLGFATEDVGATESYDIRATRGKRVVFIEVKGTTGTGESITLTANEVALHTTATDNALAIVRHIELGQTGGEAVAEGGELLLTMPWVPNASALRPIAYTYNTGIAGTSAD